MEYPQIAANIAEVIRGNRRRTGSRLAEIASRLPQEGRRQKSAANTELALPSRG
jgi:hypothetical protein